MVDYKLIGKRIAEHRLQQHLTQERLAEMSGISNNYLSNIENSHSIPSLETLINICSALDITPDAVLLRVNRSDKSYLSSDLMKKFSKCTEKEKRIINGFIDLLIKER